MLDFKNMKKGTKLLTLGGDVVEFMLYDEDAMLAEHECIVVKDDDAFLCTHHSDGKYYLALVDDRDIVSLAPEVFEEWLVYRKLQTDNNWLFEQAFISEERAKVLISDRAEIGYEYKIHHVKFDS